MREDSVALAMIVRDEAAELAVCLESVRGQVDEIVIVDTGSRDETVAVARRYTDRVYRYEWQDDFAAARNYALARCLSRWILVLDADEELQGEWGALKRLVADNPGREAFLLPLYQTVEDGPVQTRLYVLRFFRNDPAYRFVGRIHEQITVSRPEVLGIAAAPIIRHRDSSAGRRHRKRHRNLALLRRALAAEPDNPFLRYYLGLEWLGLGQPHLALPHLEEARRSLKPEQTLFRSSALWHLIGALRALGKDEEALAVCLEEVERYPEYADLFFAGGLLLAEKGEDEIAVKWFKEALRCGVPSPGFFHLTGSADFLALSYLGRSLERLGRKKEAEEAYLRALAVEPACPAALGPLFLLVLAAKGPLEMYTFFRRQGLLAHPSSANLLAELFFAAGFAGLAAACLAMEKNERIWLAPTAVHILVYGGKYEEALGYLTERRRRREELALELQEDEVVAWLLKGDPLRAEERAIELWRRPGGRGRGWGLLNLVAWYRAERIRGLPAGEYETAAVKTLLTVLDHALRFSAGPVGPEEEKVRAYQTLAARTAAVLNRVSPLGATELGAYLKAKAAAYREGREEN